jgi:hypothetical protein
MRSEPSLPKIAGISTRTIKAGLSKLRLDFISPARPVTPVMCDSGKKDALMIQQDSK